MAMNGSKSIKSAEVFTAIKSMNKHEAESHSRSKVSPIIAVVPPPKELLDSRLVGNAGIDYMNDTLQASAAGEVTLAPDICMFNIVVSSQKDRLQDAKNSVARRLDYILQALRNRRLKDSEIKVTECIRRVADGSTELFCVDSHVHVRCSNTSIYVPVNNILVEKLDRHVVVSAAEFTHELQTVQQARINASVMAVKNCKRKAVELAEAVGARLGPVIAVREEFCRQSNDVISPANEVSSDCSTVVSVPERLQQATLRITAKASVTFELRSRKHQDHKIY